MARPRPEGPLPPLTPSTSAQFEKDVKRLRKRGCDLSRLRAVIERLCARERLSPERRDHALSGEWAGCRDCHVAADWVLIYERAGTRLILHRTGTHADLFE